MALKAEVEEAPLTADGLTIDLDLTTIIEANNHTGSNTSSRSRRNSNTDGKSFTNSDGHSETANQHQKLDIDDIDE